MTLSGDSLQPLLLTVSDVSCDDTELVVLKERFFTFKTSKDYMTDFAPMFFSAKL
jgi:hypothetical protein